MLKFITKRTATNNAMEYFRDDDLKLQTGGSKSKLVKLESLENVSELLDADFLNQRTKVDSK